MKVYYKQLMKQYGGSIPFSKVKPPKKKKRLTQRKQQRKQQRKKQLVNPKLYLPRTILRIKGQLYQVNSKHKWVQVKQLK